MTDEDRKRREEERLKRIEADLLRLVELAEKHDRALFQASADGDPPMINRIGAVVNFAERGEWLLIRTQRVLLWVVGALVAFGTLHERVWLFLRRVFGE